jgi:hypothetical protein
MVSERINKYYSDFINRDIEGLVISISPVMNDIPELRSVGFCAKDGTFNIEFVVGGENTICAFSDERIEIYVGANSGKVGLVKVKNASNLKDIIVQFEASIDEFKNKSFQEVRKALSLNEKLKYLGQYDLIERQLKESKDLFETAANPSVA